MKYSHSSMSCSLWFCITYKGFGAKIEKIGHSAFMKCINMWSPQDIKHKGDLRNNLEMYFCCIAVTRFGGAYACKHTDTLAKYCFPGNFCDKYKAVDVGCIVHMPHSQIPSKWAGLGEERLKAKLGWEKATKEAWDSKSQRKSLKQ